LPKTEFGLTVNVKIIDNFLLSIKMQFLEIYKLSSGNQQLSSVKHPRFVAKNNIDIMIFESRIKSIG